jgi:hypothetical protein
MTHRMFFLTILADAETLSDGGVCGSFVHYAFVLAFVGSAFLIFLYLWKKGKLDLDEEPKIQMMDSNREEKAKSEEKDDG